MNLTIDFPILLVSATVITGLVTLLDVVFGGAKRKRQRKAAKDSLMGSTTYKQPWYVEYSRSFFPILLVVLIIRSFIFQPYRVPTGSLEPTVLPGDIIAVNQSAYGLRLPIIHTKIFDINEPQLGDIAVFRWPPNPDINFVKRVVGIPGDTITYKNKVLYINGKQAVQTVVGSRDDEESQGNIPVIEKSENLHGVNHNIYVWPQGGLDKDFTVTVPEGYYFMMGDNRDNSDDSRSWGLVPEENLIGRAYAVLFSWNGMSDNVRWSRIGQGLE